MLTPEQNRQLTEVSGATPTGELMRCYWLPIALSSELGDRPMTVRVLGEDLILFRSASGELCLLGERCAHRGTSLAAGRIERRGIRCCYHGWLYDARGQCLEQPAERPDSNFAAKVRIPAYAARDAYGLIWGYLGPDQPPALPAYDILARSDGYRRVARADTNSNYLQLLENSVDPTHTAILHVDTDLEQAYQGIPEFEYEDTPIGLRTIAWRPRSQYLRHAEFAFPTLTRVALPFMQPPVQLGFWITPVDDTHSTTFFSWFLPIDEGTPPETATELARRMEGHMFETDPGNTTVLSSRVILQDSFACESQGPIADRSAEQLGGSDRAVIALRRMLSAIETVKGGGDPPAILREPDHGIIHFDKVN